MITDLEALADRVEALSGPDRECDGWIWAHLMSDDPYIIGTKEGRFPQDPIYGVRADIMREVGGKDGADYICAPAFTASLDAAMTLASPHWAISANGDMPGWQAMDFAGGNVWHEAATPALALTAAALRALAKDKQDG